MPISDAWNNPITSHPVQVIGYRGEFDEFPHDLYSFVLSTIRDEDQRGSGLLWRWTRPMQQIWESIYSNILSLSNLISPEYCPSELLEELGKNIGLNDDISYLWGGLTELEQRRLIKNFVRFVRTRSTFMGLKESIESMTGVPCDVITYDKFRWILSGDNDTEIETAIGRDDDGYDPHLLSEYNFPVNVIPNKLDLSNYYGNYRYFFDISRLISWYSENNDLISILKDRPIPKFMRVRCLLTNESIVGPVFHSDSSGSYVPWPILGGPIYYTVLDDNYLFGQSLLDASTSPTDFRISFEPDEYVCDLCVTDDGALNRNIVRGIARFNRPISEHIYIRYYSLIEKFNDFIRCDVITGTVVEGDKQIELGDVAAETAIRLNVDGSDNWVDYAVTTKLSMGVANTYCAIRFQQRTVDYYELRIIPSNPPNIPAGVWTLYRVVGGVANMVDTGNLDWFDLDVDYIWRIVSVKSERPANDVQVIQIYQDENLLGTIVEDPVPWAGDTRGTIEIAVEDGGTLIIKKVLVNPVPMESDYVGV